MGVYAMAILPYINIILSYMYIPHQNVMLNIAIQQLENGCVIYMWCVCNR